MRCCILPIRMWWILLPLRYRCGTPCLQIRAITSKDIHSDLVDDLAVDVVVLLEMMNHWTIRRDTWQLTMQGNSVKHIPARYIPDWPRRVSWTWRKVSIVYPGTGLLLAAKPCDGAIVVVSLSKTLEVIERASIPIQFTTITVVQSRVLLEIPLLWTLTERTGKYFLKMTTTRIGSKGV